MKSMKKALALGLALAMAVTAVPVTNAQAATAPKLSATKATIYVGGNSKLFTVSTPSTWKSVKVTAASSDTSVATVKTAAKRVRVSAVKAGTAKVTVKVTGTSSGKKVTKNLAANITVKSPAARIKIDGKSVKKPTVVVGSKTVLTGVSAPKSSPITFKSSDETIATVDADGTLTALKEGTVNIAATNSLGGKYVINVTVKAYEFQSVKQTKAAELEVVIAGDTKGLGASSVQITNTSSDVNYPVKSFDVDKNDATKVKITTYQDMKDGKEYKVVIGGTEQTFTATNGVVASVGLESNTVVVAKETKVKAQTMDATGVILDTVEYPGNGTVTVTETNVAAGGYVTSEGLYLNKVGDTATFDVVYHSGKWDNATGTETIVEKKGLTVTAVDAAAVDGWAVKVGKGENSSFATVKETKLAVNDDDRFAYIQMTDSAKVTSTDISNYTVESSNVDTLVVSQTDDNNKNGVVQLLPNKVGTAYLVIKDKNTQNVVKTLPVVIVAQRKPVSLSLDKSSVSLTSGIKKADGNGFYDDSVEITATVKDQYGEDFNATIDQPEAKTVKGENNPEVSVVTATKAANANKVIVTADNTVFDNFKDTVKTISTTVTVKSGELSKKVTVNVAKAADVKDVDNRAISVTESRVDAVIKANATESTTVVATVFDTAKGAKAALADDIETVTLSKGSKELCKVTSTSPSALSVDALIKNGNTLVISGSAITINVNDLTTGNKLDAGAYTLKVSFGTSGVKDVTQTIVITDTQPKVTISRVKMSGNSVDECFEVYYDGKKQEVKPDYYDANGNDVSGKAGNVSVAYAIVTVGVGNNKLTQKVNIGLTVRVE